MKYQLLAASALALVASDYISFVAKAHAANFDYQCKDGEDVDLAKMAETLEGITKAFEEMKVKNDERLSQIEKKGAADAVTKEELTKITDELTRLKAVRDDLEKVKTKLARPAGGEGNAPDMPEAAEHKYAFLRYLRDPSNSVKLQEMQAAEKTYREAKAALAKTRDGIDLKAVDTQTGAAGGHGVPELISGRVERELPEISPIRNLVDVQQAGSKDFKILVDVGGAAYGWVGETDVRSETGTPGLEEVAPTFGTIYAYPKASEESLDDIFFNVENWLVDSTLEGFSEGEENAVVNGDGLNKPTGFLTGAPTQDADGARAFGVLQYVKTGVAADWAAANKADVFRQLIYTLKKGYRRNARWLFNKATAGELMLFKDGDGNYLWQPSALEGQPDRFFGYSVSESEEMPDKATNAFPVAFGDFKAGYVLCDLVGLRMTRDEITTPGYVKWYIRRRIGGKIKKSEAIKLIKIEL